MINESSTMKDVMNIRLAIYEEIKNLSPEEQVAYFNNASHRMEQEYGIRFRRPGDTVTQKTIDRMIV